MKRPISWTDQVDVMLSDESSSSDSEADGSGSKQANENVTTDEPVKQESSEGTAIRRAEMYQDYMKQIPIPTRRGSVIPFSSWNGLSKSIKQLYGQPLHYLTNIRLNQWDKMRIGSEDEDTPLDILIHPSKAEATIWLIEEVHRLTASHHYLANLWLSDPMPHAFIDPIFPKL